MIVGGGGGDDSEVYTLGVGDTSKTYKSLQGRGGQNSLNIERIHFLNGSFGGKSHPIGAY